MSLTQKPGWAVLCLIASGCLLAQTEKATLRGSVTDPTGAVVPNATVVVSEVATNIEARRVTTDADGNYEIADLKPSTYSVQVDQAGFRQFHADGVLVDPGHIRRLDIQLSVGSTSESVTVEGGAAVIQTDTGTITGLIDTNVRWNDAPVVDVYPSPLALLTTTPGIKGIPTNGWRIVMSGINSRDQQTWALDGVANDTNADQNDNPNFFRTVEVASVNAGADAARAASFNMVSKQGENAFHGGAYWKEENSAFNARDFFLPAATKKTPYILHELEVEQGGHIIKDRTFFFVGWMYQNIPLGSYILANVPTVEMRAGNFTTRTIKDPFNGGAPFPNNTIPASRFSAVSMAALNKYIPAQNLGGSGTFTNNYGWMHPYNQELYKGNWPFIRGDHRLTDKNTFYVRWMARKTPYIWSGTGPGEAFDNTQARDHRGLIVSDTHIFSPTLVNSFTFGHTTDFLTQGEPEKDIVPPFGDDVVKAIGLQGTNQQGFHTMGFPTMNISGLTNWTLRNPGGYTNNVTTNDGINTFTDTATWSKGRHILKFGAEARHFWRYSGAVSQDVYGNFVFNGTFTGQAFADFLLGIPYTSTRLNALVNRYAHQNQVGFFVNDSFKVTSRLTLDYGLRWDYYGTPVFNDGLMYNWDPTSGNVIVAKGTLSKISALYPTSLIKVVEGDVTPSPTLRNYRPRISAAYRLNDKTVLRGGYGEFTATYAYYTGLLTGGPFQVSETYTNSFTNNTPLVSFPNPFPSSLSLASVPGQSITGVPMNWTNGVIRQYNVTLERQVKDLGLRLSYVGSRGSGMEYSLNVDKPQASTTAFTASRNPWPQFTSATEYRNDGAWRYNALQAEVQKRAGALTFDSNITWGSNYANYLKTQDPYNVTNNWSHNPDDRLYYWVTSAMWPVPLGKGRQFLPNLPGPAEKVLGGWGLQGIVTMASGGYYSPAFSGSDPSHTNTSGGLPDCISNPYNLNQTPNSWWSLGAFGVPPSGRYGNCAQNALEGYGIRVAHLSVAKTFSITERIKTTFTAQISNLLNHPNFVSVNTNISNPNFGMFTAVAPNYMPEKTGYRQIDFKLRFVW